MNQLSPTALVGSYTPVVTPFSGGRVDLEAFEALIDRQATNGSQGVVVTGTSGEPSVLTVAERLELVRAAVRAADGRLPVVAGSGTESLDSTLELSLGAARAGADALLVVTPYYIRPPQRGLEEYFVEVAGRVELPMLVYHIPGRAAVTLEVATIAAIAERADNLVGMKHASTDLGLVTEVLRRLGPEFRVFAGLEELSLPMLAVGACGMMNAVGNLAPARVAALWHAVESGDLAGARKIHDELWELNKSVFFDTNPIPIKYMLRRMGVLASNEHRLPMASATPELEARLDAVLERAGLLP
ncbi:MAG: 4-hydroxy-tetrahydrodipicolinate synthase [Actinomycetota bacterium]|jgi:4-hydroxy-tetrahydrodipicolinate synthase|nr:4-hydroxy-tetrahydrodipicolinate synthase [Actinomycetota bacterium]